eukprot:TRINITY_DN5669_c0_g2_i1.p1 TRINITY_DN5669_c0_g2~~TRINITY_DN5669_c0_g2_i1.p1  ORF type:complete len:149 (-),score=12.05 TRINITY_DN5669_c0_g2_i1:714-1160(-)
MDPNAQQWSSNPNPQTQYSSKYELMSLSFLSFITLITIIRANDQHFKIPCAINICFLGMLLFLCIDVFSRLPEDAEKRERFRAPIFILANIINFSYVCAISEYLSPTMTWLMLVLIGSTCVVGTLYMLLCPTKTNHKDESDVKRCSSV